MSLESEYIGHLQDDILKFIIAYENQSDIESVLNDISEWILNFQQFSEGSQREIRKSITRDVAEYLIILSGNLALYSMSNRDNKLLLSALLCHCIEDFRFDYRENIRRLTLIWEASKIQEADFGQLVTAVEGCASESGQQRLEEFSSRPKEMKDLNQKAYKIVKIDNRMKLVRI